VAKHLGPPPGFVELGHDCPAPVPDELAAALVATTRSALAACGLHRGAAHTELRVSGTGPVVIEINPRLAGGMIPTLVRLTTGIDLVDRVIAFASGGAAGRRAPDAPHAAIRFRTAAHDGVVAHVDATAAAAAAGVERAVVTVAEGDRITLTRSFRDRVGYVIATGSSTGEAAWRAENAISGLTVELTPPPRSR
jgi:S-sulfo-L-cysteine synthase (3-phospho-L-serine-dependent)